MAGFTNILIESGFHDTANAVATVIYTKALKPMVAVPWSGTFNFLGVFTGGVADAMGILVYRIFNTSTVNKVMDRSIKAILVMHE